MQSNGYAEHIRAINGYAEHTICLLGTLAHNIIIIMHIGYIMTHTMKKLQMAFSFSKECFQFQA